MKVGESPARWVIRRFVEPYARPDEATRTGDDEAARAGGDEEADGSRGSRLRAYRSWVAGVASAVLVTVIGAVATSMVLRLTHGSEGDASVSATPTTTRGPAHASAAPKLDAPAHDGEDPYHQADCKKDEQVVDQRPMSWPDGTPYGNVTLFFSATCRAAWGYVYGPNSAKWSIHIVAHRDTDHASAPAQFSGNTRPNSWGNVLSTDTGCVYAKAYVTENGDSSAPAVTDCVNTSGTVTHR